MKTPRGDTTRKTPHTEETTLHVSHTGLLSGLRCDLMQTLLDVLSTCSEETKAYGKTRLPSTTEVEQCVGVRVSVCIWKELRITVCWCFCSECGALLTAVMHSLNRVEDIEEEQRNDRVRQQRDRQTM